ncbi:MAG: permease prefix domain 1-containing protein [Phycisphaerales bacterium]
MMTLLHPLRSLSHAPSQVSLDALDGPEREQLRAPATLDSWLAVFAQLLAMAPAARLEITAELRAHLAERSRDLMLEGRSDGEALHIAISELGDAAELARGFADARTYSKRRRFRMHLLLAGLCCGVVTVGVISTTSQREEGLAPYPSNTFTPSAKIAAGPPGRFDDPIFSTGEVAQDAEPTSATAGEPQLQKRVYVWEANPLAFLVRAFETIGYRRDIALSTAQAVMAQTDFDVITEPDAFLRYAFSAAGFTAQRAEHAAVHVVNVLTAEIGELRAATDTPGIRVRQPEPGVSSIQPYNKKAFYEWESSLYGSVTAAMRRVGFAGQEAADRALDALILLEFYPESAARAQREDWREINPHTLLQEVFFALGYDPIESDLMALRALVELNVPGFLPRPAASTSGTCPAYPVRIIYCDSSLEQKIVEDWILRNSWDNLVAACPATVTCAQGQVPWATLTLSDKDCLEGTPPVGTCIWIHPDGELEDINCDLARLNRDCFDETTGTYNCAAIEWVCGDENTGPSNCPDCDPS